MNIFLNSKLKMNNWAWFHGIFFFMVGLSVFISCSGDIVDRLENYPVAAEQNAVYASILKRVMMPMKAHHPKKHGKRFTI